MLKKVKCPAKINLTLEVENKRPDGFHNIKSIMQTINLYDILTIDADYSNEFKITLSGTSKDIPYDKSNLVYKACQKFYEATSIKFQANIHIEKNIPVAAGLAGGSTDAAGTLLGLNSIFKSLEHKQLHKICAELGSDLNFCLEGGCKLATGRGEKLQDVEFKEFDVCLIKPKNLGISAKEAYTKYSLLEFKQKNNMTEKYITGDTSAIYNDLETALINDYTELKQIKNEYPNSVMSGSGSTFFIMQKNLSNKISDKYEIYEGLKSIRHGCEVI